MTGLDRRALILLAASGSFVLLLAAFFFQAIGYAPCKMCLWQRWPHVAAVAFGAIGFFRPARTVAIGGALAALMTGGIGLYHAGVEYNFWEGPASCSGSGPGLSGLSGSALLDPSLAGSVVMCDEVAWSLMGISMAGWNALFSLALAVVWATAAFRPDASRPGPAGRARL